jgi:hypothetical protein
MALCRLTESQEQEEERTPVLWTERPTGAIRGRVHSDPLLVVSAFQPPIRSFSRIRKVRKFIKSKHEIQYLMHKVQE